MATRLRDLLKTEEKWKVLLAIGAPIAVGMFGFWYYRRRKYKTQNVTELPLNDIKSGSSTDASVKNPLSEAKEVKDKGNKFFKIGKYDDAVRCYSEAIEMCPERYKQERSTFHQNRAAAFDHMKDYASVVKDCDIAISLNNNYTKAYLRRSKAYEHLNEKMKAFVDMTAVCLLEAFKNPASLRTADQLLKDLSKDEAKVIFTKRSPTLPSRNYTRNYYKGFVNDPVLNDVPPLDSGIMSDNELKIYEEDDAEKITNDDNTDEATKENLQRPYQAARESLLKEEYDDIINLCTREIDDPVSSDSALAQLLRGTFYLLRGELDLAKADFTHVTDNEELDKKIQVNALIKLGSIFMQEDQQTECLDAFAKAVRLDPENSDVYYHRGQQNLVLTRIDDALRDFDRAINLNPKFALCHVQRCFGEYQKAIQEENPLQMQVIAKKFADIVTSFPDSADGHLLYAHTLTEQMRYEEAHEQYKKASTIDPDNASILVYCGLLQVQWKRDIESALSLIKESIKIDPKCEFAYETLGTLLVQKNDIKSGLEHYDKAIKLCKTEAELTHIVSLKIAALAQTQVVNDFKIEFPPTGLFS